jgi:hypothetical protein
MKMDERIFALFAIALGILVVIGGLLWDRRKW